MFSSHSAHVVFPSLSICALPRLLPGTCPRLLHPQAHRIANNETLWSCHFHNGIDAQTEKVLPWACFCLHNERPMLFTKRIMVSWNEAYLLEWNRSVLFCTKRRLFNMCDLNRFGGDGTEEKISLIFKLRCHVKDKEMGTTLCAINSGIYWSNQIMSRFVPEEKLRPTLCFHRRLLKGLA